MRRTQSLISLLAFFSATLLLGSGQISKNHTHTQSLNTTDSPTFAGVTTPLVQTPDVEGLTSGTTLTMQGGSATGSGSGAAVRILGGVGGTGNSGGRLELIAGPGVLGATSGASLTLPSGPTADDSGSGWALLGIAVSGTNIPGEDSTLAGSRSTGNAPGGSVVVQVAPPGVSGVGTNSPAEVARFAHTGLTIASGKAARLTPVAFASLPASPAEGDMAWVNNASTKVCGATVAGGGANKVGVVYNGTNWVAAMGCTPS